MFRKKKESQILRIFEELNKEPEEENEERVFIKDKIINFIKNYKYQSFIYQVAWFIRILCWILICIAAVYGAVSRIKNIF